ncbi:cyclin-dependent kinase-like Serine/Threonine kinase family protein (macronuclear) [Tetrahymena thermophila SB210]|uniref:Cyclin-dependent kinase-like Serine/Threonine kinase family protein n=1 Tax=Tetrahymena thermophila (strain SB210) TaxID=312017 RepID=Q233Z3_TETTS|nr:cyclin-dependent kinase-like Serine/Threonine kinase family protein [Tetrahymena thermophila SB210]EAR92109.2 cyclin-dependent kinase-like Serine/Threonine kinase family protein [Tetrahymena thermophila SB210]|eukprot:XP_001012355.2 cyclin-dependent kinase-like Serine/Threonine kinase family protein [Tetrahymena thermophila SB210]
MQHQGNNKISLIVNNHIQQFEIKATLPFSNRSNFKPPLYRGNAHLLVANGKKNHSLSIHHPHHFHLNNNGNHLKVIPTTNKKPKNLNSNNNNSINNISINHSNSNSINLQSNIPNSFHRPQSPVVLNISSDRHNLYQQQQQQYSFQHQAHNQIHNNSNNNNNNNNNNTNNNCNNVGLGGNFGQLGFMRDRPQRKNRHNSIKLIKQKAEHSVSSKQISSINILQSHNPNYQKHNIIPSLIESPITKSSHNHNNHSNINGNFSSNDHTSDLDKANNSSNTNNGTISNINISNIQIMNNSSSNNNTNSNQNGNSSSQNYNNSNNQNQNNSISSSFQNIGGHQNNFPISTESNRNSINNLSSINNNNNINNSCSNTNHNNKSNLSSYKRQEKKYRISKTQILFPFNSKENICDPESQNAAQNSSSKNNTSNACNQNQSNHNSSQKINNINNSHYGSNSNNLHALKLISHNPKIVNNQNFEEDVILFNKAISQPTEVLREQMALGTPPQLAAYTTSATTDTIHRQSFRIKHYNLSSRQSSRGGLKSTQTSDPISSLQTHNNIGESISQSNTNNNTNQLYYVNKQTLAKLSHQELGDLSPCNKHQNPPQYHYHHNNFNQNNFPYNYNFNQKSSSNINSSNNNINNAHLNYGSNHVNNQQGRILSSRSANKISQNMIKKIIRQPSTHIQSEEGNSIIRRGNIQNNKLNQQVNAIVRKNSYWQNQREQLERKKKKEKSMISSNNDVTETHHTIIAAQQNQQTEPFSIDDQEEENKNQHLLFKFPSKDEKQFFIQHDKNIDQANINRRDNSPKLCLNISNNNNLNTINTNNPKSSKRTSIGRISQKQQQLLAHQPVHQVQVQQNINQQHQQQQQQQLQQIQQIQNKFPQFNLQSQLQSNGQNILNSINQNNNLFSLNQMSTLLNIKTLSIKKAISNDYSNRHDDIMITGTNPFHDVELRELLGEGAYGKVYKGFIKKTGKFIAVKQLKLGLKDNNKLQEKLEQYLQEIALLNHLEHPNIVKYYDCKHEEDNILIYMEQMPGGSLSSMLEKFGRFEEALIKKFVKQIISGLAYLHSQGIVHRDIKGANILTDGNGTVKLADFGAARYRDTICLPTADGSEFCNSIKGSLYWMAPELLNQESHGRKSDIWSLGCTMIEMATGKHPWPDCRTFPQLALIVKTNQCPPIPEHLSDECKDFIRQCCTFDKKERPTADVLLKHPFLNGD